MTPTNSHASVHVHEPGIAFLQPLFDVGPRFHERDTILDTIDDDIGASRHRIAVDVARWQFEGAFVKRIAKRTDAKLGNVGGDLRERALQCVALVEVLRLGACARDRPFREQ